MITKGYIMSKAVDPAKFTVRLPVFEGVNGNEANVYKPFTVDATVLMTPGNFLGYNINDVVFVGFEDNDYSKPIILGKLYTGTIDTQNSVKEINSQLTVNDTAILPADTSIGKVSAQGLKALEGIGGNDKTLVQQLKFILDKLGVS